MKNIWSAYFIPCQLLLCKPDVETVSDGEEIEQAHGQLQNMCGGTDGDLVSDILFIHVVI